MILIIQGPQGTGKSTIAAKIAHSTHCKVYDEMPQTYPADMPPGGLVLITTNAPQLPGWLTDVNHAVVSTTPDLLHSPLELDVHPFEWISALLADYKTLREKATAAGIPNDDPDSESEMLSHVSRFVSSAISITYQ